VTKLACWGLLGALLLSGAALADDVTAPAPALDDSWASRGLLGYSKTGGNTDTSAANFLFHVAHVVDDWKFLFGAEGVYGSTKGETTVQAWDAHFQSNYNLTERLYLYGALRYDDDKFDGFAYQELATAGVGYQFIKSDATKLTAQVGAGPRRLRPELLSEDEVGGIVSTTELAPQTDVVLDAAVTFEHAFNESTKLIAGALTESGKNNTLTSANAAIQVKMSNTLALAAGIQYTRNSKPPVGVSPTATLTTLSLVYEIKNPGLAPQ
jgi:putative salt-induced outer membrane protein